MKTLSDATEIGPMKLKNRLWRSATWLNMADEEGFPTDRLTEAYLKLAKGGTGTLITGYAHVLKEEQPNPGMLGIYSDIFISPYRSFTNRIHAAGAHIVMQICYGGSATDYRPESRKIWGPSAVAHPMFGVTPVEMTREDIRDVVRAHARAARRVRESGFDGVQIHAAHSYLFSQFLSPFFNRRSDEYGGSIENRSRIVLETLKAVRKEVGEEFPVFIKMHASDDWGDQGLTADESLFVARELERNGISGIEFSGGNPDIRRNDQLGPVRKGILKEDRQSYFAEETAAIAACLSVPVISVGGHRDPDRLEGLLEETEVSYFSLSRTLLSEPDLPGRWLSGNRTKPRCVSCNRCWAAEGNRCILDR